MSELNWQSANLLARTHGESFFIYDDCVLERNFQSLKKAFNDRYFPTQIAYSYKTNYTPYICRQVDLLGGFAEVVSEMEYALAKKLNIPDEKIIYNGPCKSPDSLKKALLSGAKINIDSVSDFEILDQIAKEVPSRSFGVAIRCNFPIDGKLESRFGLDIDGEEFRRVLEGIRRSSQFQLVGLHCHFPNRDLPSYEVRARQMLSLSSELFEKPPEFLNLGGGFFGRMPESMQKTFGGSVPSFDDYGKIIGNRFHEAFRDTARPPILFIEPGTALVADTMKFVTRVTGVKKIRSRWCAFVQGSIFNISPTARTLNLSVTILKQPGSSVAEPERSERERLYDICGYTCIENDYLSKSLRGSMASGDFLVYENVGSYSIVMKPPFILPNAPILLDQGGTGKFSVIKNRESFDSIFGSFVGV